MENVIRQKMETAGLSRAASKAFLASYEQLKLNVTGLIAEPSIEPVAELPSSADLPALHDAEELLRQTVIIKLNGGLGTSMGLEKAKSLLPIRDGLTFLDLIARQILHLRRTAPVRFLVMNSFATSADTLTFLQKYPELGSELELLQNKVPKLTIDDLAPVEWPQNPALEWCPPGHGDIYAALDGSGWLERLLDEGVRYAFVSNSDNLGATLDPAILQYFAEQDVSFLMEATRRAAADRKGGHLAREKSSGHLLLRESAQCAEDEMAFFQDIERHRFFNTNNLWLRLDHLRETMRANDGVLPLPMIRNRKTVDPRDSQSPPVWQLETAMGAAISAFPKAAAIAVPRTRFAPVKTTADLLTLRSDACVITANSRLQLADRREGRPPLIDLDSKHYKFVDQLDAAIPDGPPSLIDCEKLEISGPVLFPANFIVRGKATISNPSSDRKTIPGTSLENSTLTL